MISKTEHPHVVVDKNRCDGEPIIRGTKTTVRAIVELWRLGIHPEEITHHLPHISLAQIFDALSYYSENKKQINEYINRNHVPNDLVYPALRPNNSH